jgi:hypothetical protein
MRLLAVLVFSLISSSGVAAEPLPEFVITFWVSPPPNLTDVEHFKDIADCGFNMVMPNCLTVDVENNKKMLDACKGVGLKAIVQDARVYVDDKASEEALLKGADAVIADYSAHPALGGYFLRDEPGAQVFGKIGAVWKRLRAKDPKHWPYVNLFPNYATPAQLGTATYADHIAAYISTVKPNVVWWDHYTLNTADPHAPYFENLATVRDLAQKSALPYMIFIATVSFEGHPEPSDVGIRWQVYTSLAYGVSGIGYFTYATVPGMGPGLIDAEGKRTPRFAVVKDLNQRIKALGPTLLELKSVAAYHTDPVPAGAQSVAQSSIVKKVEGGPLLIGVLKDAKQRQHVFVVNRSLTARIDAKLTFENAVKGLHEISQESGKQIDTTWSDHVLACALEAGCGRLFALDR